MDKRHTYSIRLDNEQLRLVNECCEQLNIPKTVLFKNALDIYFQYIGLKERTFAFIFNVMSDEQKAAAEQLAASVLTDIIHDNKSPLEKGLDVIKDLSDQAVKNILGDDNDEVC